MLGHGVNLGKLALGNDAGVETEVDRGEIDVGALRIHILKTLLASRAEITLVGGDVGTADVAALGGDVGGIAGAGGLVVLAASGGHRESDSHNSHDR